MKKLMILGASALQLPAIIRAKELGHYTVVLDYDPKAVGIAFADEFYPVSTVDIAGVLEIAKKIQPAGILTLATDMPMRSVAAVCQAMNLPGISPETAYLSTDKAMMIEQFDKEGVAHPWYYVVKTEAELARIQDHLSYPCIAKPTDNSGSRGVLRVEGRQRLKEAWQYSSEHSPSGTVIFEEYMSGPEVSAEIIISRGIPHIVAITDKVTSGPPYFVELSHSQGSQLPEAIQAEIRELAGKAAVAVKITEGAGHAEIIVTETGVKMVEIGARLGGGCLATHLVPLSTGVDMVEAVIIQALGGTPNLQRRYSRGSAIHFFNPPPGKILAIDGIDKAKESPGIKEVTLLRGIGDYVRELRSGADRIGYIIGTGENAKEAKANCADAIKKVSFQIGN